MKKKLRTPATVASGLTKGYNEELLSAFLWCENCLFFQQKKKNKSLN